LLHAGLGSLFSIGDESAALDLAQALYFSVVTLATVGYGDISPPLDPSKAVFWIVVVQILCGVYYLGVFVATTVSWVRGVQRPLTLAALLEESRALDRQDAQLLPPIPCGKYGNLSFVESKARGEFTFPFTSETNKYRLMNGALYPMLGAFRWMVDKDPKTGKSRWRGGFRNVLRLWESAAAELLRATVQTSVELGRNPNAIGKSRNHWSNLYTRVALRDLQTQVGPKSN
jgi:hypothetical protein